MSISSCISSSCWFLVKIAVKNLVVGLHVMSAVLDSMNAVSSSMSSVGYRHDNSALTEQRVAQILSEARAAMKAVDAARTQVYYSMSY